MLHICTWTQADTHKWILKHIVTQTYPIHNDTDTQTYGNTQADTYTHTDTYKHA